MKNLMLGAAMAALLAACGGAPTAPADTPAGGYAADIGEKQLPPDPGAAPAADAYPLAPSAAAKTSCADDGERFPLSGVCAGRAVAYMPTDSVEPEAPAGCAWNAKEVWFGGDVMLYRALDCGTKTTALDYAGGAHAAELSYTASALHPDAVPNPADPMASNPVIRVSETYAGKPDGRLTETIGSDANIAKCEIKAAGAGFPDTAKVIVPKQPGADCGLYAMTDKTSTFWLVRDAWTFAFSLPKGAHDVDPASFVVVTPQ